MKTLNPLLLFFYCALIFWLSNQPSVAISMSLPHIDKVIHTGAYFIMGILVWRTFSSRFPNPVGLTILFCSVYGISDEWHQSFIIGRSAEVGDWIADTIGGIFSVLFMHNLKHFHQRIKQRKS